jgi:protein PhnA
MHAGCRSAINSPSTSPATKPGKAAALPSRRAAPNERNGMSDVKDMNGNILADGDQVTVIKDLKVKGTSVTLKRGTLIKNIRLTGDPAEIECNAEKVKGLVLRTEFLKKA